MDVVMPIIVTCNEIIPMAVKAIELIRKTSDVNLIIVESSSYFEDYADVHIEQDKNYHFAKNVNDGLKETTSDYICIASDDVFVSDGWYEGMMECFKEEGCGVATLLSSQFNEEKRDLIEEGFFGGFWTLSRKCFNNVGYLDERFINSFEDSDYWLRVLSAGYKLRINRNHIVEHLVMKTVSTDPNHQDNYSKNRKLFIEKHKDCGLPLYERLK